MFYIKKHKLKDLTFYFLGFLFVFGFQLSFLFINSAKLAIIILFIAFVFGCAKQKKQTIRFNGEITLICLYLSVLAILSAFYTISHGENDFSLSYAYSIFLLEAVIGGCLLYQLYLKSLTFDEILHFFVIICFIQSLIILSMLGLEPFRSLVYSLSDHQGDLLERYEGIRGFGLAGSITYDLSVFLSIGLIFISYLICYESNRRPFYLFAWVAIFMAILVTGRTGWAGILLSLSFLLINSRRKVVITTLSYMFFLFSAFSILSFYFISSFSPGIYHSHILPIFNFAFELFINLYSTGSASTRSTDHLQEMYFALESSTLLYGDGRWFNADGSRYMGTDAGYMRHILFYGIVPSLLIYFLYIYGYFRMISLWGKENRNRAILFVMLFVYYFLAHYKGDFLTGSPMNIKLFSIFFVYTVLNKYSINNELYSASRGSIAAQK